MYEIIQIDLLLRGDINLDIITIFQNKVWPMHVFCSECIDKKNAFG